MNAPRLDEWLVDQGHYPSRARARDAINRGCVQVGGGLIAKPSRKVINPEEITVCDPAKTYVSRAALKLEAALGETGLSPRDKICLDLGASTGGFCEVLLRQGASHVFGIDVGHDQMATSLRADPRITSREGLNARDLTLNDLDGHAPEFLTSDVSFISLRLALPPALDLAGPGAVGVFLVKPQFEVGKDHIGRGGIVRDPEVAASAANALAQWLDEQDGWRTTHFMLSPLKGGDGNTEYLLAGEKRG